jgi:cytidylate kinase
MDRAIIDFEVRDGAVCVRIDGRHVGPEIRTEAVNKHVSPVSAQPEVRRRIVDWLRGMSKLGPLVMEGRDIGTAVFPDTPFKFYLDASPEERARRRHAESAAGSTVDEVRSSISRRDAIDSSRSVAPLQAARGAVVIDTTSMGVREVVAAISGRIRDGMAAAS